jgi:hypothetical protein
VLAVLLVEPVPDAVLVEPVEELPVLIPVDVGEEPELVGFEDAMEVV